jgi:hypothetical protein
MYSPAQKYVPIEARLENARQRGRWRVHDLVCHFGGRNKARVVDLSAAGARLHISGRVKVSANQQINVRMNWDRNQTIVLGRVVWVRQVARREFLVGVSFESLNASQTAEIRQLATLASDSLTVAQKDRRFRAREK